MYSYFSDDFIEEVRINNDIVDVVSEYVKLEKKGKYYFGLCPFHKEKTASFSVTPSKQIFYCYSCQKGGNVIHFIMNVDNIDFVEAVKHLAERARLQMPEQDEEETQREKNKKDLMSINIEAAKFFFNQLNEKKNETPREYFKKRGILNSTVRKFGLGYSPNEWDALYKFLKDKGFNDELILQSGLIIKGKNDKLYDRFRGRIIFPIFDVRGNIIAFGGRVLDDSLPKYLNSPETLIYSKSKNLYALNFAKNSSEKRIIVVEGYMDVISLHQSGIINTVASLGTALTQSHGMLLKKYYEEIIISFDSDAAGQTATLRGINLLNDAGCTVKVLEIPEGKDPDEFINKKGQKAFNELMNNAVSLLEYRVGSLRKQIDTEKIEGKVLFLNKLADLLVKVDNNIEREMYLNKIAKEYAINEETLYAEILKRTRNKAGQISLKKLISVKHKHDGNDIIKQKKIDHEERILLSLLVLDNSIYELVKKELSPTDFLEEYNRKLAYWIFERFDEKKKLVTGEVLNFIDTSLVHEFTKIIQEECVFDDNKKAALDIINKIKLNKLDARQQEILNILANKEQNTERNVEKLKAELNSVIIKKRDYKLK